MEDILLKAHGEWHHMTKYHIWNYNSFLKLPEQYNMAFLKKNLIDLFICFFYCSKFFTHFLIIRSKDTTRSKIYYFQSVFLPGGFIQNILRFQISMNNILFMAIMHCRKHLFNSKSCFFFAETLVFNNLFK